MMTKEDIHNYLTGMGFIPVIEKNFCVDYATPGDEYRIFDEDIQLLLKSHTLEDMKALAYVVFNLSEDRLIVRDGEVVTRDIVVPDNVRNSYKNFMVHKFSARGLS